MEASAWRTNLELTLGTVAIPTGLGRSQFYWILSQRWMISGTSKAATERTLPPLNKVRLYTLSFGVATFLRALSLTFWDLYMAGILPSATPVLNIFCHTMQGMWVLVCLGGWGVIFFDVMSSSCMAICQLAITSVQAW